ncbi:spore germination protein KB [Paenibacillus sp. UNC496MF]|uniref:GerAB/ArcD/ProY family transporter n=1 Tax=Paenibacillus sp. UNC496MF TaxID=1502753 RepID=UPI0008E215AA|nr:endospore germination permease [Paenibacillus sp. UNC496MF]SFJ41076.1 spore germination protein KB [Paenibacillus sp. UNC496MF]
MKISGYQLFWLINISSMIMYSYLPIQLAAEVSAQDCWISELLGSAAMMAITWLMLRLCIRHPNKTLVGFLKELLGTVLGKLLATAYFALWFMQLSLIAKGTIEFQNLVMLHNTPMIVILLLLLFTVAYAVWKGGLTAVSRCAEVIGPILMFTLFTQLFLNPQDMELGRILPVYADSGWYRILKGAWHSIYYMMDPSIVLMLFFFAENKRTASRAVIWGTAIAMLWGVLATLVVLFVTGPNMAAEMIAPIYSLTKFVSILNFIQNIDAIYIPLWLLGAFVKLAVGLFILSYGLSEWSGFKNWKLIAGLMTCAAVGYILYSGHHARLANTLKNPYLVNYFYPFVYLVVPPLLWAIGSIRKGRRTPGIR